MDELIQVQIGSPAWCPAPGTEILDVVKRGDSPLLAIVEQQGRKYMAHCILGESGSSRLWVYHRLDTIEALRLREHSPDKVDETADSLTRGPLVATVTDGDEVVYSAALDVPNDDFDHRISFVVNQLHQQVDRAKYGLDQISEVLAQKP